MPRKNTTRAVEALLDGRPAQPSRSIWTDGRHLWSYGTCIAARLHDGTFVFNDTRYSRTTSGQQSGARFLLGERVSYLLDGLPIGATPYDLVMALAVGSPRVSVWSA